MRAKNGQQYRIAETLTTFESRMEGLCMVAFTRFPALGGGFRKKVKAVKDVGISYDNIGLFCLIIKIDSLQLCIKTGAFVLVCC